jgi:hypothetical protein
VLGCEARWLADEGFDGWSVENLTGTVVHRAIDRGPWGGGNRGVMLDVLSRRSRAGLGQCRAVR